MNCFLDLASAISGTDTALRQGYVDNVQNTVYLAFSLMDIQKNWTAQLENDRTMAVYYSMMPDPGASAMAASYNVAYQADSQGKDSQCGEWQSMVQANQTQIDNDNDARQTNMSIADGMAATLSLCNGLITSS